MFGSAVVKELLRFQTLKTTIEPKLENEASPQTDLWKKGAPQFLFNENNNITKNIQNISYIYNNTDIYTNFSHALRLFREFESCKPFYEFESW
jgi:hypothetical protein